MNELILMDRIIHIIHIRFLRHEQSSTIYYPFLLSCSGKRLLTSPSGQASGARNSFLRYSFRRYAELLNKWNVEAKN